MLLGVVVINQWVENLDEVGDQPLFGYRVDHEVLVNEPIKYLAHEEVREYINPLNLVLQYRRQRP